MYSDIVLPKIDSLFNEIAPNGAVHRFDSIEIDFGRISKDQFEDYLLNQIPAVFKRILTSKVAEQLSSNAESIELEGIKIRISPGSVVKPMKDDAFETLLFFLKTGLLPWWSDKGKSEVLQQDKVNALLANLSELELKKLKEAVRDDFAARRFANLLSSSEIALKKSITEKGNLPGFPQKLPNTTFLSELLSELDLGLKRALVSSETIKNIKAIVLQELAQETLLFRSIQPGEMRAEFPELEKHFQKVFFLVLRILKEEGFSKIVLDRHRKDFIRNQIETGGLLGDYLKKKNTDSLFNEMLNDTELTDSEHHSKIKDKSGNESEIENLLKDGIFIENAGLILLWPFIHTLFSNLEFTDENGFKSDSDRERACLLLQDLVTGTTEYAEPDLALNKILCGLPLQYPITVDLELTEKEEKECAELIEAAIEKWKGIGNVSLEGFREAFLQREGKLELKNAGWNLKVDRKTIDVLLDRLPWGIGMVKLKWMKQMIYVDW